MDFAGLGKELARERAKEPLAAEKESADSPSQNGKMPKRDLRVVDPEALAAALARNALDQAGLASKADVGKHTVTRAVRGHAVRASSFFKIAEAVGLAPDQLGGQAPWAPPEPEVLPESLEKAVGKIAEAIASAFLAKVDQLLAERAATSSIQPAAGPGAGGNASQGNQDDLRAEIEALTRKQLETQRALHHVQIQLNSSANPLG